jgi:hypothetical protein
MNTVYFPVVISRPLPCSWMQYVLRNVGKHLQDYTSSQSSRPQYFIYIPHREKLISQTASSFQRFLFISVMTGFLYVIVINRNIVIH